jgi:hypothetical protein
VLRTSPARYRGNRPHQALEIQCRDRFADDADTKGARRSGAAELSPSERRCRPSRGASECRAPTAPSGTVGAGSQTAGYRDKMGDASRPRDLRIVRGLIKPRQFIERRLVASFPITVFRQVKLLVLVIFDAGAVLIAPAVSFSIDAAWFHKGRLSSRMPERHTAKTVKFSDRPL